MTDEEAQRVIEIAKALARPIHPIEPLSDQGRVPDYHESTELHQAAGPNGGDPHWFGVLDYDPKVDCAALSPPMDVSENRYLIVLKPTPGNAAAPVIHELVPNAAFYATVPFFEASCDEVVAKKLARLDGVLRVFRAAAGVDQTSGIVAGIDLLATFDIMQRTREYEAVIGGRQEGEEPGYPILAERDGELFLEHDPQVLWGARPAAMPVVNISLGTLALDYPHVLNDPVNLALTGAARNQLIVMAGGNCGEHDGRESMSAWAESPHVLSVGATEDEGGTTLADYSSRGIPSDPESGPDVVAWGASALDTRVRGTSFAAPRVSRCALVCAAAMLQLRTAYLIASGQPVEGVPLVGMGIIDGFGPEMFFNSMGRRLPAPALPIVGPNMDGIGGIVHAAADARISLQVAVDHRLVRRVLLAAARPMSGYGPHEVGAGFLSLEVFLDYLAHFTADDFLTLFASGEPPNELRRKAQTWTMFDPHQVQSLARVVLATAPYWLWDYRERRLGWRLDVNEHPQELSAHERRYGKRVPWP